MNLTPTEYINRNRETIPPQVLAYLLDLEQATLTLEELSNEIDILNSELTEEESQRWKAEAALEESEAYAKELREELDNFKGHQP